MMLYGCIRACWVPAYSLRACWVLPKLLVADFASLLVVLLHLTQYF